MWVNSRPIKSDRTRELKNLAYYFLDRNGQIPEHANEEAAPCRIRHTQLKHFNMVIILSLSMDLGTPGDGLRMSCPSRYYVAHIMT